MSISFHGIGQVCTTFLGECITEGHVVKMTGNSTVAPCGDGENFCGVAVCCKDDACSVQVDGFAVLPYSGTAPTVGWSSLAADGTGGVKTDEGGRSYLVVHVDTTAKTVSIKL